MNIDTAELEKAVVAQAVQTLVDDYSDPHSDIATAIHTKAKELILARVNIEVDNAIKTLVDTQLEAIIFPRTNSYGEAKKPPQTLREFVAEQVELVFKEYLDNDGKPTNDNWYKKPECQRINKVIKKVVGDKIEADVIAASKTIQDHINHYVGEFVKVQLNDAAKRFQK